MCSHQLEALPDVVSTDLHGHSSTRLVVKNFLKHLETNSKITTFSHSIRKILSFIRG